MFADFFAAGDLSFINGDLAAIDVARLSDMLLLPTEIAGETTTAAAVGAEEELLHAKDEEFEEEGSSREPILPDTEPSSPGRPVA